MRSCFRIVLVLSLAFVLAGCNLPTPMPAVTPAPLRASPTSLLPRDTPTASEQATLVPTASVPANWQTYTDQQYGFTFRYPKEGQIANHENGYARINGLPFAPGTNLAEKYMEVNVAQNAFPCPSPNVDIESGSGGSQQILVNGIVFQQQNGVGAAAGNIFEWTAYSTQKANVCASLTFVLHSANPGNYLTPPPLFDKTAESKLFSSILATFAWLNP